MKSRQNTGAFGSSSPRLAYRDFHFDGAGEGQSRRSSLKLTDRLAAGNDLTSCISLLQNAASCEKGNAVPAGEEGVRVTATITRRQHRLLRALAARHKVSVAWLVRHAIDRLLS